MQNKCFGLWKAYLQLEQPTSLGWNLFSTLSMDTELLKEAISDRIENIPISLCLCTINIGSQGPIPPDQQVKALHIYINKSDVNMAKHCSQHFLQYNITGTPISIAYPHVPHSQAGCHSEYERLTEHQKIAHLLEYMDVRETCSNQNLGDWTVGWWKWTLRIIPPRCNDDSMPPH